MAQTKPVTLDSILNTFNDTSIIGNNQVSQQAPPLTDKKWNSIKTNIFVLHIGAAILFDFNTVAQDAANEVQVGDIASKGEFRGDRLVLSGHFLFNKKLPDHMHWRYMISVNFNGLDAPQGKKSFEFVDWNLEIPISSKAGWITLGKQKEGVGIEYIAPGTQLYFMERSTATPMFVRQRNIGIRYSNHFLKQRMTCTTGFFNNYWESGKSFRANGSQITARISGLPYYTSDRNLLHTGVAYRYTEAIEGKLSYKAKPETNTAPSFINTGSFDARKANSLMLEALYVHGPFSVLSDYVYTTVQTRNSGNVNLSGFQVGASWFITGENRRYNKTTGNLGKLVPKKIFKFRQGSGAGAFELGARYSQADGTDQHITGGVFNRFTTALSWYPNTHFRLEMNYGRGRLDKNQIIGKAGFWQFRIQFEI